MAVHGTWAAPPGPTDSLTRPEFIHWPRRTQWRLAKAAAQPGEAPALAQMMRTTAFSPAMRAWLTLRLGRAYIHEVQPSLAAQQFLETRQRALALHDTALYCHASYELCYAYQLLLQPRRGLACGEEAVRMAPARHRAGFLAAAYTMMGECAGKLHDFPLALRYYRQALRYDPPQPGTQATFVKYFNLAETSLRMDREAQCRRYLDTATATLPGIRTRDHGLPAYISIGLQQLQGTLALHHRDYAAAAAHFEPLIAQVRFNHDPVTERDVLELLVEALRHLGRYREALAYQSRYVELVHTMYEEQAGRQTQEMQVLYDTHQKEAELVRQRQRIAVLQLRTQQQQAQNRHRTWLVGALLAGAALLLALVLLRQRARHALARRADAQRLRDRIAADLHDEVGTLLARVSMQADLLRHTHTQPADTPALDRLLANTRAAAGLMRDIVWGIDSHADTTGALLDRMREYLDQVASPAGLHTHLTVAGLDDNWPLASELRQHLFLVFKEAVTNAVRHAQGATDLWVSLMRGQGELKLQVRDNGRPAPPTGRISGLGLRSMRQRATALRGTLVTGPARDTGFSVELSVPA
jgi:signal transduction histidine kinase